MATEEGIVKEINGNLASILIRRTTMCEHCSTKHSCTTLGGNKDMIAEAYNTADAKIGDRVVINVKSESALKVTFSVYMLPVLFLVGGAIWGLNIGKKNSWDPELSAILIGLVFFIISFSIVILFGRKLRKNKNFMPEVIKVVPVSDYINIKIPGQETGN